MANLTDYAENLIAAHYFGDSAFPKPSNLHAALFTTTPNDAGSGGTETTYTNYARQSVAPGASNWTIGAAASGVVVVENAAAITFPAPGSGPVTLVGFGLYDASSGGNLIAAKALNASVEVDDGGPAIEIAAGDLTITVTAETNYMADSIAKLIFSSLTNTQPANLYLLLQSVMPDAAGAGGTIITGSAVGVGPGTDKWNMPSGGAGIVSNAEVITTGEPASTPVTAVGVTIRDATSGGNILLRKTFASPLNFTSAAARCRWPAGNFNFSIA